MVKKKRVPLRYLFLNGELMKVLFISRPKDEIELWSYPKKTRAVYTYSDVKKRMGKAYTTTEVAKMLNRNPITLKRAVYDGDIEPPQFTYGLTETGRMHQYMWCEKDIMSMHELLLSRTAGGNNFTPKRIPNARELRAMIRQEAIFYVRTDDGFVPTWKANEF